MGTGTKDRFSESMEVNLVVQALIADKCLVSQKGLWRRGILEAYLEGDLSIKFLNARGDAEFPKYLRVHAGVPLHSMNILVIRTATSHHQGCPHLTIRSIRMR